MVTGVDQPLDGAGVLLEHFLQDWHRPMPAILGESAFGIELRDGGRIHGVALSVLITSRPQAGSPPVQLVAT